MYVCMYGLQYMHIALNLRQNSGISGFTPDLNDCCTSMNWVNSIHLQLNKNIVSNS